MCVSTDYPHFDSDFPEVSSSLLNALPREIAADILYGGARLHGFSEDDFVKADAAAAKRKQAGAAIAG